jgi:MFS family permease
MSNNLSGYRAILRHKQYTKLIAANVINRFGDSIDAIAFTWLVYELSGSAAWSAIIFGVNMLPTVVFGPFAGALAEHMDKKWTMVISDITRGLLVALTAALYVFNVLTPVLMLVITLLHSTVEAFRVPCGIAIVPRLLPKEDYEFGLSLNSSLSRVTEIVGLACAAGIIAAISISGAIFIDGITFFLSALLIALIKAGQEKENGEPAEKQDYWRTLKGGISYVLKTRTILNLCLLALLLNSLLVPLNALNAPLINMYNLGPEAMSAAGILLTAGAGLGAFIYPFIKRRLSGKSVTIAGFLAISLCYGALVWLKELTAFPALFFTGLCITLLLFSVTMALLGGHFNVMVMKKVNQDYLARVGSTMNAVCTLAMPVISFCMGGLTLLLGLSGVLYLFGGISFVSLLLLIRFRVLDSMD